MASILTQQLEHRPPTPVFWAVIATLLNAIGGVLFTATWPDLDERGTMITVSLVLAVFMIGAAAWLWTAARWGALATIALNAFNVLLCLPGFFADDGAIIGGSSISLALSAIALVLLFRPEARAFWQHGAAATA